MRHARRTAASVLVAVVMINALASCQTARAGARCRTKEPGQDATFVLVCRNGRWTRVITKADGQRILDQVLVTAKLGAAADSTDLPTFLQGFLDAWKASNREAMYRYGPKSVIDSFNYPNGEFVEAVLHWQDPECLEGSSGMGACSVSMVQPNGFSMNVYISYHETDRAGHQTIDSFDAVGDNS